MMERKPSRIICLFLILMAITDIFFWYSHDMVTEYIASCPSASKAESHNANNFPTGMWTVQPFGRLGNLIGQYATLYAFAKRNGHQAYILPEMHAELSGMFRIKLPVINRNVANQISWKTFNISHNWMSKEYYNISGEYVKLSGYPFSWTFYHHLREEIIREFTFHDYVRDKCNADLADIRGNKTNVTFIGVHVRRGDYVGIMGRSKKDVVASKEYLQKAMEYFRNKYKIPLFVVISNGIDWCKQNINNSLGDVHFLGDGNESSPTHDFSLLAHCNHTIMTIGTFGMYAAYLAGGETIYLANYTLPDFPRVMSFTDETIYLPEWKGIPADLSSLLKNKD